MARAHPLVAAALATAAASVASAAITTFEVQIPLRNTRTPVVIDVPQFDASFGTLERVEFSIEVGYSGVSRGENTSRLHGTEYLSQIDFDARVFSPAGMVIARAGGTEIVRGSLEAFDGSFDYAGRSGYAVPFASSDRTEWAVTHEPALRQYVGPGTLGFMAMASANTFSEGDIGILQSFETDAFLVISVRYDFAVPGPGVPAALGLFAIAAFRRR